MGVDMDMPSSHMKAPPIGSSSHPCPLSACSLGEQPRVALGRRWPAATTPCKYGPRSIPWGPQMCGHKIHVSLRWTLCNFKVPRGSPATSPEALPPPKRPAIGSRRAPLAHSSPFPLTRGTVAAKREPPQSLLRVAPRIEL